jgi:8-oxo-dGTP pyrophosphatase MutT (NUDIX family)
VNLTLLRHPGEEPLTAAKREAEEEAALTDLAFPFGEIYCDTAFNGVCP